MPCYGCGVDLGELEILMDLGKSLAASRVIAPLPIGLIPSIANDEFEVVVARLEVKPEAICVLATLLTAEERDRAHRFAFDRDRRRFIVSRARLRQLLSMRLAVRPESIELIYGKHGKPALAPPFADSGLRFNVSHSEDIAVYAFSMGREIGIDVEAVRTINDADAIAARFFSPRENEAYLALDLRDKTRGFFNCWTRKEAFIKAHGDGLSYPLDRFDVSLAPDEPAKILRVADAQGNACGWALDSFEPASGFVGAIVMQLHPDEAVVIDHPKRFVSSADMATGPANAPDFYSVARRCPQL
jgi:4'-phosphopantetheinyl transferase